MAWLRDVYNLLKIHDIAKEGSVEAPLLERSRKEAVPNLGRRYRQSPLSSNVAQKKGWDEPPFSRI
jgi:hypothetical protein